MIAIDRVRFKNVCQYVDRTFHFSRGFTGIIGPIGSGKSNLLAMTYSGLTNDFRFLFGPKEANVRQFSTGDVSYIEIAGVAAKLPFTLVRGLSGKTTTLTIGDRKQIRGDRAVTDALFEFFPDSAEVFREHVFVGQGHISAWIDQTMAVRVNALNTLFKIDKAEKIYKQLGAELLALPGETSDQAVVELALRVESCASKVQTLNLERANLLRQLDGIDVDGLAKVIEDAATRRRLMQRLLDTTAKLATDEAAIVAAAAEADNATAAYEASKLEVSSLAADADAAKQKLAVAQAALKLRNERVRLMEDIASYSATVAAPARPDIWLSAAEMGQEEAVIADLRIERSKLQLLIDAGVKPFPVCPTCGADFAAARESLLANRQRISAIDAEILLRKEKLAATTSYNDAFATHARNELSRLEKLAEAQKTLDAIPAIDDVEDTQPLQVVIEAARTAGWKLDALATACSAAASKLAASQATKVANVAADRDIRSQLAAVDYATDVYAADAAQKLSAHTQLSDTLKRTIADLTAADFSLRMDQELLAKLKLQRAESVKREQWRSLLTATRELLHRENLPRVATTNCLASIEDAVNLMLDDLDCDFTVETVPEELTFRAVFRDGRVEMAPRLSGGQKVLLSLAYRLVVSAMFAGDVGMLWLDEPTQFLPDRNLAGIDVAFNRLRGIAKARDLQVVVVTHADRLAPLFDRVISLEADEQLTAGANV